MAREPAVSTTRDRKPRPPYSTPMALIDIHQTFTQNHVLLRRKVIGLSRLGQMRASTDLGSQKYCCPRVTALKILASTVLKHLTRLFLVQVGRQCSILVDRALMSSALECQIKGLTNPFLPLPPFSMDSLLSFGFSVSVSLLWPNNLTPIGQGLPPP